MEGMLLLGAFGAVVGAVLVLTGAGGGSIAVPLLLFGAGLTMQEASRHRGLRDAALLAQTGLANLDAVRDEMCSERLTAEDFLNNSFGFCIQHDHELVSWAFSEYNTGGNCEVGIATVEKYRRMGLGTVAALALVEHAIATGYHTIGWHCWANNIPSAALARRAGFEHRLDYSVDLLLLPPFE